MIELTRLNGSPLVVNSDLIQYAESAPDTTLTFLNGEKVVVRESPARVIDLAVAFRARMMGEEAERCPGGILASRAALRALSADKSCAAHEEIELGINYAAHRRTMQD
ncbi:MAG: flagellar FlbD family protein [Silvibacterium sp.]|nr:flagellar FlbD family protein [Silvibacterium sp.]